VIRLTIDRAREILDAAGDVAVLVVGDLMLDRYLRGSVDRISPEAPVPVVRVAGEGATAGGAANVAANVVALGARCRIVGCVGEDAGADELARELEGLGVETAGLVRVAERPTTVKTRVMAMHQQIVRFDHESDDDVDDRTALRLVAAMESAAEGSRAIVLEDYNKGVLVPSVVRATLERAVAMGVPTIVDPKRWRFFEFTGATVFKPNARELAEAMGEPVRPEDEAWLEEARLRVAAEHLLVTLGAAGMVLQGPDGHVLRIPTVARQVYDVSGAGDTVTAVTAVALAGGATPAEAAVLANHAAAVVVGKSGVHPASYEELLRQVERAAPDNEAHAKP
jgi:D-beta-D-heptose 7-phosphate kinase/D-beta-D-heptose 1-phosphate adenosyltransferase